MNHEYISFVVKGQMTIATVAEVFGHSPEAVQELDKDRSLILKIETGVVSLSPKYAAKAVALLRQLKEGEVAEEKAETERLRAEGKALPWEM